MLCPGCGNAIPEQADACPHTGCGTTIAHDTKDLLAAICSEVADIDWHKRARGPVLQNVVEVSVGALKQEIPKTPEALVAITCMTAAYLSSLQEVLINGPNPAAIAGIMDRLREHIPPKGLKKK